MYDLIFRHALKIYQNNNLMNLIFDKMCFAQINYEKISCPNSLLGNFIPRLTSSPEGLKDFAHKQSQVQLASEIIEKLESNHLVKKTMNQ